ncbi:MAG: Gfo/Idh/MocA family oxidoreductase [Parcubacteria group bacterium]|jgi:predicted dehydrogenase
MKKVTYGVAGCGEHALRAHVLPGKDIPELELNGICDINPDNLARFCENFGGGLTSYSSIEKLLAAPDLDAVLIATPDEFHLEQLRLAIGAGKHVLIEKPLAVKHADLEDLDCLLRLAASRGLVVTTCHPRRFDPPFTWIKNRMGTAIEELGPVASFNFDFSYHRPEAAWKASRSLLLDHLNHEIDLVHYILGITSFDAEMVSDSFDHYRVTGQRDDGIFLNFHGTRRLESKVYLESLVLRHDRGEIRIDAHSGSAVIANHETGETHVRDCGMTDYYIRSLRIMRNFVETIQGVSENYLTPQDLWVNNWLGTTLKEYGHAKFSLEPM